MTIPPEEKAPEGQPGTPEAAVEQPKGGETEPVVQEQPKKKVNKLKLDFDPTHDEHRINLVSESGVHVGQALYDRVTVPDMVLASNIQLHKADEEKADDAKDHIDDPKVVEEIREHLSKDHLNAVLVVLFKRFHDNFGGEVCEANPGSITFGQESGVTGFNPGKEIESGGNNVTRNFIIPPSGREEMKSLISGVTGLSIGKSAEKFNISNRIVPNALGEKGFSVQWGAGDIVFDLNFFYGAEEKDGPEELEEKQANQPVAGNI